MGATFDYLPAIGALYRGAVHGAWRPVIQSVGKAQVCRHRVMTLVETDTDYEVMVPDVTTGGPKPSTITSSMDNLTIEVAMDMLWLIAPCADTPRCDEPSPAPLSTA